MRQKSNCIECGAVVSGRSPRCHPCAMRRSRIAQESYVDEMAVERLLIGSPVRSTRAERQAATAILDARGYDSRQIAERIGISRRQVVRHRARIRAEAIA